MTEDIKVENVDKNGDTSEAGESNLPEHKAWSDKKSSPDKNGSLDANGFRKRKASDGDKDVVVTPAKKKKGSGVSPPKNPVQTLNEYKPGLEYVVMSQSGPSHAPNFVVGVTVNGIQYSGVGGSKKIAKQVAAEAALKSLIQFKNPAEAQAAMGVKVGGENMDFTADDNIIGTNGKEVKTEKPEVESSPAEPKGKKTKPAKKVSAGQNPLMTLNELKPGLAWNCSETGHSPATKKFCMKTDIDGESYEGSGVSKKLAKQAAAKSILNKLFNMSFTLGDMEADGDAEGELKVAGTDMVLSEFSENQSIADNIGRLILEKYDELMVGHKQISRRKVIAGIVMTLDADMKKMVVVCVSTGTKCVSGEYMSVSGTALNDCHAEIISRRCLMDYIYSQLEKIANSDGEVDEDSILVRSAWGGYKIKENVKFHLYINTAPCGDARIFSPHEFESRGRQVYGRFDDHPNRKARGQLRTKIESGEGTIPVKNSEGIQTWDGVMQGSRLLTMSCADKVCRWNVLGVQGSLLAYFLEPVYLHSVVLGSLFHPTHMYRALTGRVKDTLDPLPPRYKLNTPKFNLMTSKEVRNPGKGPNYSVNWTIGNKDIEVVDAMKGKVQDTQFPSRLSKYNMFKRWTQLAESKYIYRVETIPEAVPTNYSEAKQGSTKFQEAKKALFKAFSKATLGDWIKKPMEQDEFEI